jgi:sugar lactone lactonase YvrE
VSELGCPAPKWTEARHAKLVNGYMTPAPREVATGLRFPEGPVAMPDGSVILVEIENQLDRA